MIAAITRALPGSGSRSLPGWPTLRRRLLLAGLLVLAFWAPYMLWLRDSALVAVERVTVEGAEAAPAAEQALRTAALEQTTLHIDVGELERAVASDPAVRGVSAEPDFPHGLTVRVDVREPVGYLSSAGVVVAGDGIVLGSEKPPDGIATLKVKGDDLVGGGSVNGDAMRVATVLGAAPPPLLAEVDSATISPEHGVVAEIGPGIELRFGVRGEPALKWQAAAAVLADPKLDSVAYIDLSVPDRPVAGGVEQPSSGA